MTKTAKAKAVFGNGWLKLILAVGVIVFAAGQVQQKIGDIGINLVAVQKQTNTQGNDIAVLQEVINGNRDMLVMIQADLRQIRDFIMSQQTRAPG